MTRIPTAALVETLAENAKPVTPLAAPLRRAAETLIAAAVAGAIVILLFGDMAGLHRRYSGREALMFAEMATMLLTFILAVAGAFTLAVPGRSKAWLIAPLPSFILWFALSGVGCYFGSNAGDLVHSTNCLLFILAASVGVGIPLLWRLSRARPIDPLPVALLGGLAAAALSAFLLQFFHPFQLTLIDLFVHVGAVLLVLAIAAIAKRPFLAPA